MTKKLSRIVALMLAVIMSFSMLLVPVEAASFKDVSNKAWYKAAVDYVAERGWMSGVSSTTFAPNMKVTRGMAVTVLAKVAEADLSAYEPAFADTEAGKWYTKAAAWAADKGIVAGVGDGMFAPNRVITRQDLAVMLNSFIQFMEYELPAEEPKYFDDISNISGYAMDGAYVCSSIGLINGYEDGKFHPTAGATRAQLAQMIMRMDQLLNVEKTPAVPMPAQSFDKTTADEAIQVQVEAPDGALPEDSQMTVSRVIDEADLAAIQAKIDRPVFAAADITFTKDGAELEPEKAVMVQFYMDDIAEMKNPTIVHVKDDGTIEYVYGAETVSLSRSGAKKAIRFYAKDFSVYAVVGDGETGDNARVAVQFYNGSKMIAEMFVKNKDRQNDDTLAQVLYDPGVGEIPEGQLFKGWGTKADYTAADAESSKTIQQIRTQLKGTAITEGMEPIKFYAMFFSVYTVSYLDEVGTCMQTDTLFTKGGDPYEDYKVNVPYTPKSQDAKFEGWNRVVDGSTSGAAIQNGTFIDVDTDIVFSPKVPDGHWLVFKENGSGATYTPPQFIYSGGHGTQPANPTRFGYTFGGWYTNEACTGSQYNFSTVLMARTVLYAKWTPNATSNYSVIIWKHNMAATDYDFDTIISLSGSTGSTVNTVSERGSGKDTYVRVNGTDYRRPGFHLKEYTQNVTITADGNAVVNVYYDRNTYTITFIGCTNTSNTSYYQNVTNSSGSTISWCYVPRSNRSTTIKTVEVLYEQDISDIWEFTGSNGTTYPYTIGTGNSARKSCWRPSYDQYNRITFLPKMEKTQDITFTELYSTGQTQRYFYYFVEALEGETIPDDVPTRQYNNKTYKQYKYLPNDFNSVVRSADFFDIDGFTQLQITDSNNQTVNIANNGTYWTDISLSSGATPNTLYFYYSRNSARIHYMDGLYFSGRDVELHNHTTNSLGQSAALLYQKDLSSYNKGGDDYEDGLTPNETGFLFEGWYADKGCTQEYNFTTMPKDGITVYAKWRQIEYRVFLHPNVPTSDTSFDMGDQSTCFRVAYDGQVNEVGATRDLFELIGWYTDNETFENNFQFDVFAMNEANVTDPYDRTGDTELDKYGNYDPNNKNHLAQGQNADDVNNRWWINNRLDLYAKWRSKIVGANGVHVVFDATETGEFAEGAQTWTNESLIYSDNTKCTAAAAPSAKEDTKYYFTNWRVYKYENGEYVATDVTVMPGQSFTVYVNDAMVEDLPEAQQQPGVTKKYTVLVKAEYGEFDKQTPTHIYWVGNGGTITYLDKDSNVQTTDDVLKYDDLGINEAIAIPTSCEREGYVFLGWARVTEDGTHATFQPDNTLSYNDVWLRYHPADTIDTETTDSTTGQVITTPKANTERYTLIETGVSADKTVTKVAADEDTPYQILYAVWSSDFYVYHSSDGKLEAVSLNNVDSEGKIDLTSYVRKDYLYGGYYLEKADATDATKMTPGYNGVKLENVNAAKNDALWGTKDANNQLVREAKVNEFKPYNGNELYTDGSVKPTYDDNMQQQNERLWDPGKAGTVNGRNSLKPNNGDVYYLKEVPKAYLKSKFVYVCDKKEEYDLCGLFLLSVVDDRTYQNMGFRYAEIDTNSGATDATSFAKEITTITQDAQLANKFRYTSWQWSRTAEMTYDNFAVGHGYLAISAYDKPLEQFSVDTTYALLPTWETYDGVLVGNEASLITVQQKKVVIADSIPEHKYTIQFLNEDGTVLQTSKLASGETPQYTGDTPTKDEDEAFTYTFTGWDKEIVEVTADVTYTAQFSKTAKHLYVVLPDFWDGDGALTYFWCWSDTNPGQWCTEQPERIIDEENNKTFRLPDEIKEYGSFIILRVNPTINQNPTASPWDYQWGEGNKSGNLSVPAEDSEFIKFHWYSDAWFEFDDVSYLN